MLNVIPSCVILRPCMGHKWRQLINVGGLLIFSLGMCGVHEGLQLIFFICEGVLKFDISLITHVSHAWWGLHENFKAGMVYTYL